MFTRKLPIIHFVDGTTELDAFSIPGEEIDVRHICPDGIIALLGTMPPPLQPTRIELAARYLPRGKA